MSAPKFKHYHIDLDTMTVTFIGTTTHQDVLKHPSGLTFVILDDGTWVRSDQNPVWSKLEHGKEKAITIATATTD